MVLETPFSLLERAAAPSDRLDVEKLSPLNGVCALSPLSRKYLENTVSLAAFHRAEGSHSTARAKSWLAGAIQRCAQMEKPLCWKRSGGKPCCLSPGDHEALADCGWEVLCVPESWKRGKD